MKLWLFSFTDQKKPLAQIVVRADTKPDAARLIENALSTRIRLGARTRNRVIAAFHGEDAASSESAILSATRRDGQRIAI